MMRSCLSLPKMSFLLRTSRPALHSHAYQKFDGVVRAYLDYLTSMGLTDNQWHQATLPIKMGGLGLRKVEHHAEAAFLTAKAMGHDLIEAITRSTRRASGAAALEENTQSNRDTDNKEALEALNNRVQEPYSGDTLVGRTQKSISADIDVFDAKRLEETITGDHEKARMHALTMTHAGDWVMAIPSKSLNLHLGNRDFRVAIRHRLGMRLYGEDTACKFCDRMSDRYGRHSLVCTKQTGAWIHRHNSLRDSLFVVAQSAGLGPTKEEMGLISDRQDKPGDITIPQWKGGRGAAFDVAVTSTDQVSTLKQASKQAGVAARRKYTSKMNKAKDLVEAENHSFHPLIIETYGGWHPESELVIRELARRMAANLKRDEEETIRHVFQRLSMLLVRGNATLFSRRTQAPAPAHTDGDDDGSGEQHDTGILEPSEAARARHQADFE